MTDWGEYLLQLLEGTGLLLIHASWRVGGLSRSRFGKEKGTRRDEGRRTGCRIPETLHAGEERAPRAVGSPSVGPTLMASGTLRRFRLMLHFFCVWYLFFIKYLLSFSLCTYFTRKKEKPRGIEDRQVMHVKSSQANRRSVRSTGSALFQHA